MRLSTLTILVICLLAGVGALLAIWVSVGKRSPPPLSIEFLGYTNHTGEKFATFRVTNRSAIKRQFFAFGQTPHNPQGWEEFVARSESPSSDPYWTYLAPGESAQFSILVFVPNKSYRLCLKVKQRVSKWTQLRRTWSEWCAVHRLPRVGVLLYRDAGNPTIAGPEVQQ